MKNSRNNYVLSEMNLLFYGLAYTTIYEYITDGGMTMVLTYPLIAVWEIMFEYLKAANSILTSFLEEGRPYNEEIRYFLNGDLCAVYFKDRPECYTDNVGTVNHGMLAMDSSMQKFLRGVKDFYDSSNRTFAAQQEALITTNMLNAELLYEVYSKTAYKELGKVLIAQFDAELDKYTRESVTLTVCSVIVWIISSLLIWHPVRRRAEKERLKCRNMLKMVPIAVIMNNRFLKSYLQVHSKKILDSIKNKI